MGVSDNRGTPKWMVSNRENPMKTYENPIGDHPFWGTPIFGNTHIFDYTSETWMIRATPEFLDRHHLVGLGTEVQMQFACHQDEVQLWVVYQVRGGEDLPSAPQMVIGEWWWHPLGMVTR